MVFLAAPPPITLPLVQGSPDTTLKTSCKLVPRADPGWISLQDSGYILPYAVAAAPRI